jgi:hypothetical protein
VTYRMNCGGVMLEFTHWTPEFFFDLDEEYIVPVGVRAFAGRNGNARYELSFRGGSDDGEAF